MLRSLLFPLIFFFGSLSVVLPTTRTLAQISPDSGVFNWDPDSLEIIDSETMTFSTAVDLEGNIALVPEFSGIFSVSEEFACHLQSYDGMSSILVFGTIWADGTSDFDTVVATRFNGSTAFGLMYVGMGCQFDDPGFWSDYWYFLTGGSAPADPAWLNYGSEAGFGVAAVSLTAAGGIVLWGPAAGGGAVGGTGTIGGATVGGGTTATGVATAAEAVTAFGGTAAVGQAIGMGVGPAAAIARTATITLAEVNTAGITLPVARWWVIFYETAVTNGTGGAAAPARVLLWKRIVEILGG